MHRHHLRSFTPLKDKRSSLHPTLRSWLTLSRQHLTSFTVTLIHGVQKALTVQASSALARAPQKAVVTNCFVSTGAVVSTPVYHPHTLLSSYCMFLPTLFETKQQLKGTGRMSAMLWSPASLQVVQWMQSTPYGRLLFYRSWLFFRVGRKDKHTSDPQSQPQKTPHCTLHSGAPQPRRGHVHCLDFAVLLD